MYLAAAVGRCVAEPGLVEEGGHHEMPGALERQLAATADPEHVEPDVLDVVWTIPLDRRQFLGQCADPSGPGWVESANATMFGRQPLQQRDERGVTSVPPVPRHAVESQTDVPAAVAGQVAAEYEQPVRGSAVRPGVANEPHLRVEHPSGPRLPDLMQHRLQEREQRRSARRTVMCPA